MGEARRRRSQTRNRAREIEAQFVQLGIDCSQPGFDSPEFIRCERADPRFLELYAEWVLLRPRSAQEDARTREIVPLLAEIVTARLRRHGWFGGCVAVTGMVSRMLDRIGIWNCTFRGSATIANLRSGKTRHFAIIDEHEGEGYQTGHMWLAVPPFEVVDMTLRFQRWESDPFQEAIAPALLLEHTEQVRPRAEDVFAPAVLMARAARYGRSSVGMSPDQERIARIFPARRSVVGDCEYRHVPGGVTATDVPLEQINIEGRQGPPAIEIWREDVVPKLGLPGEQ